MIECDDSSLAEDSLLRDWGPNLGRSAENSGRKAGIMNTMQDAIERAGFRNVHIKDYKVPIGPWPRDKQLKEAGVASFRHLSEGMEGYCMWLLTKFGEPAPWSMNEVIVYVAELRKEIMNPRIHCYHRA